MRQFVDFLSSRAASLDLRVRGLEASTLIEITAFGTAVMMNYRYSGSINRQKNLMNIVLLHTQDALEPPVDPVLEQIDGALREGRHECRRLVVSDQVEPLVTSLAANRPDVVFNIAESFAGRSALESNVAALLEDRELGSEVGR